MTDFRLDPADLARLKKPFGIIFEGGPDRTMPELKALIKQESPTKISAVGDVVSRETLARRISVDLRIIDHKSLRKPTQKFRLSNQKIYRVRNPAGVITSEARDAIKRAMNEKRVVIIVDGEEDLLTLPCITESPDRAFVLYGQPNQGLVVVNVDSHIRSETNGILGRMIRDESEKSQQL